MDDSFNELEFRDDIICAMDCAMGRYRPYSDDVIDGKPNPRRPFSVTLIDGAAIAKTVLHDVCIVYRSGHGVIRVNFSDLGDHDLILFPADLIYDNPVTCMDFVDLMCPDNDYDMVPGTQNPFSKIFCSFTVNGEEIRESIGVAIADSFEPIPPEMKINMEKFRNKLKH